MVLILDEISKGDQLPLEPLVRVIYEDLKTSVADALIWERNAYPLYPSDLVGSSFARLVDRTEVTLPARANFLSVGAQALRRVLVDDARARPSRCGMGSIRLPHPDDPRSSFGSLGDIVAVDDIISKLATLDSVHSRILEWKLFGGLGDEEVAYLLGVSVAAARGDWDMVRAWTLRELWGRPHREGFCTMRSLSSWVTDWTTKVFRATHSAR